MSLRSVDLNLLVALEALLSERHVTRAAERVGLSQPAMSNARGRLRGMCGDELLVRTATGMQATPRAVELAEPLRQVLRQVERVLESDAGFDPESSERTFTIRMSDIRMVKDRSELSGLKPASLSSTRSTCRSNCRRGSASSTARGVACMPVAVRTSSSSPNIPRSRPRALLMAGWLKPTRSEALVTCRSDSRASKATNRFR